MVYRKAQIHNASAVQAGAPGMLCLPADSRDSLYEPGIRKKRKREDWAQGRRILHVSARDRGVSTESREDLDAEGPLRRWARRKREVAREKEVGDEARRRDERREPPDAAGNACESADDASEAVVIEEEALTDEDMPPLDTLGEDSDYSGFLSPGVSEALRRRALRKLFSSAVFNIPDGLDDYDDDFTSFAALGDIVTSDMKHQAEVEAERARQAQSGTEPAPEIEGGSSPVEDERLERADEESPSRAEAKPAGETAPGELPAPAYSVAPQVAGDVTPSRVEARPARETESEELSAPTEPVPLRAAADEESPSRAEAKPAGETAPDEPSASAQSVSPQSVAYEDDETPANAGHPSDRRT